MAKYNEHKCLACGQIFDYCRRCAITPIIYKAEGFCSEKCSQIFAILSKHGCNLITADEALSELSAYNLDEITLTKDILAHIEKIKSEASIKTASIAEEEVVVADTTVKTTNKNSKKKW